MEYVVNALKVSNNNLIIILVSVFGSLILIFLVSFVSSKFKKRRGGLDKKEYEKQLDELENINDKID